VRKLYWAITIGEPKRLAGTIKVPLLKVAGNARGDGAEKIVPILDEPEELPGTFDSILPNNLADPVAYIDG